MASLELRTSSETADEAGYGRRSSNGKDEIKESRKIRKRRAKYVPKFGCFRSEHDEGLEMEADCTGEPSNPTHLVITVNGLIGSAQNWKFAAKQLLKKYPKDVIVHCSKANYSMSTFDGVDVMGNRLAEEVLLVIKRYPDVQKISFIGHSLGGLVARYAIARLYERDATGELSQENGDKKNDRSGDSYLQEKLKGKIAGLEPMNFITSATPHLGSRGHKQVPVFCGFYTLEKAASHTSWLFGRSGKHLFLTDCDNGKPPLLLQMAGDCEDLKFMSALQSFRRRVAYANARFDHIVGWSTSSIRHRNELPKRQHFARNEKYPHIVNEEVTKISSPQQEVPLKVKGNGRKSIDMEEEMIRGLMKVSWERIDVNFKRSTQRFLAHNTIQVKNYCINSDGKDVILHMVDNFLL
ncbi:hypothetical protein VitviT2T_027393 [Vitis vinifera]|uniref:DUF676 domain-containing protein n=2 Tax=Vitis vinifera TaxID=29760 RepID=A0ABY9DPW6_VITVI|eukprot:XP_002283560.1 PREDICTED: putative lipase ROG1 [Vitis vinifera]